MNARRWAAQLLAAEESATLHLMATAPARTLQEKYDITVTRSTEITPRGAGGWCDGMSNTQGRVVLYRPTRSRRQNFTLCHELGHFLIEQDDDCFDWCMDQPESGRVVEELCDEIASRILVTSEQRAALPRPVTASSVVELFEQTDASRSVCLNVVVDALPGDGFGVLIDGNDPETVFYASRKEETRPYAWKGDPVPGSHVLRRIGTARAYRSRWQYPDGTTRELYLSADTHGDWIIGLFADTNLWDVPGGSFADPGKESTGANADVTCKSCGYSGSTSWFACNECRQSPCPRCEECDCDRRERTITRDRCTYCTVSVPADQLEDGLCTNCR